MKLNEIELTLNDGDGYVVTAVESGDVPGSQLEHVVAFGQCSGVDLSFVVGWREDQFVRSPNKKQFLSFHSFC